ncbi:MAG: hypothetical protein F2650_07885 [Actinobacteria bacterium]|nr:hypothetical protein [Actinomycetota bacterium]
MGYVPQDPLYPHSTGAQFQRRQRRRTSVDRSSESQRALATIRLARARWAEQRAADWYVSHGFTIIARNWTMRGGELDVVARRGNLIAVCEVKARATNVYGSPLEAMTELKQQRVRRAGFAFLRSLEESGLQIRFDVASVLGTQLEMHEDIF